MNGKTEKSAGCIIYKKSDAGYLYFLIVKDKAHNNWGFPKGHLEAGESDVDAALRETKEEVGLDVSIVDGFKETITYSLENNVTKSVVYFLAEYKGGEIDYTITDEIVEHKWLPKYEAIGRVTFVNAALLIQKARDFIVENHR